MLDKILSKLIGQEVSFDKAKEASGILSLTLETVSRFRTRLSWFFFDLMKNVKHMERLSDEPESKNPKSSITLIKFQTNY